MLVADEECDGIYYDQRAKRGDFDTSLQPAEQQREMEERRRYCSPESERLYRVLEGPADCSIQ